MNSYFLKNTDQLTQLAIDAGNSLAITLGEKYLDQIENDVDELEVYKTEVIDFHVSELESKFEAWAEENANHCDTLSAYYDCLQETLPHELTQARCVELLSAKGDHYNATEEECERVARAIDVIDATTDFDTVYSYIETNCINEEKGGEYHAITDSITTISCGEAEHETESEINEYDLPEYIDEDDFRAAAEKSLGEYYYYNTGISVALCLDVEALVSYLLGESED